jgi:hypothetical protein
MRVSLKDFETLVKEVEPKQMFGTWSGRPQGIAGLVKRANKCQVKDTWEVSLEDLTYFSETIWQVGTKDSPWQKAKKQYEKAVCYLVDQLFLQGTVGPRAISPQDALLLGDYKKNWMEMLLVKETYFWHRSAVEPSDIMASRGLMTRYASEICMPEGGMVGDWRYGSKFVFAVKAARDENGDPILEGSAKSGGKLKEFGFGKYAYLLRQPGGTRYMSDNPVSTSNQGSAAQVGFPDDIPLDHITVYSGGKKLDLR